MYKIISIISILLLIIACGNEQETLVKNIMDTHDAVMPKTAEIERLRAQIKRYKDATEDVAMKDTLISTYLLLSQADDAMMDWMSGYKEPSKDQDATSAITYLKKEEIAIKKVSDDMLHSIEVATALLANAPDSIKNAK